MFESNQEKDEAVSGGEMQQYGVQGIIYEISQSEAEENMNIIRFMTKTYKNRKPSSTQRNTSESLHLSTNLPRKHIELSAVIYSTAFCLVA